MLKKPLEKNIDNLHYTDNNFNSEKVKFGHTNDIGVNIKI